MLFNRPNKRRSREIRGHLFVVNEQRSEDWVDGCSFFLVKALDYLRTLVSKFYCCYICLSGYHGSQWGLNFLLYKRSELAVEPQHYGIHVYKDVRDLSLGMFLRGQIRRKTLGKS